jgi:hypothetical protein
MRTTVMYVMMALILLARSVPLRGATLSFQQTWGGSNFDRAEGVAVAPGGNIYVVGNTPSFSVSGDPDIFLLKYAPDGTLLLQQTYGTAGGFEDGNGVAVGPDGSIYVAGSSDNSKALLVKFDPNGALLWQRTWGGTLGETALGVAVSGDGASVYSTSLLAPAWTETPARHSKRVPNFVSRPNIGLPGNENRPGSPAVR